MTRHRAAVALAVIIVLGWSLAAAAQRRGFFGGRYGGIQNVDYDGRFNMVRTQYARYGGGPPTSRRWNAT